ncbi:MAG: leucine-rich repeat domain-containing protein [Clostridiales bacterium]|nr:leucine-rich repeat domain-containing protein [Clostridiales bacterium]
MKKKLLKLLTLVFLILATLVFSFACALDSGKLGGGNENAEQKQEIDDGKVNNDQMPQHTHSYALKYDINNHWEECECGDKKNSAVHNGGTATCSEKAICTICNQPYGELGNIHNYTAGKCFCGEYEPTYYTEGLVFELDGESNVYKVTDYNGTLNEVVIPSIYQDKPVTSIASYAFNCCVSLTSIQIPNSVTNIGYGAFFNCSSLTSIEIPNGVTSIGDSAFVYCSSLISIEIPNSLTSIGDNAFCECCSLTYNIKNGLKYLGNNSNPYLYLADTINTSITTAIIDNNCKFIGEWAFCECDSLTSIEIPKSVTNIESYAFDGCASLTSIEIPNNVTSLDNSVFANCVLLTSVAIGNKLTCMGAFSFYNCTSLTNIKYSGTESQWAAISKGDRWNYNTGSYTITYNYDGE